MLGVMIGDSKEGKAVDIGRALGSRGERHIGTETDQQNELIELSPRVAVIRNTKNENGIAMRVMRHGDTKGYLSVIGDAITNDRLRECCCDEMKPDAPYYQDLHGRWFSIAECEGAGAPVRFATDILGALWMYFTEIEPEVVVFSTDFARIARLANKRSDIDPRAVRQAIVLGYMMGNSTLHPEIQLAPGGCVFRWTFGIGITVEHEYRVKFGDEVERMSDKRRVEHIVSMFHETAARWKQDLPDTSAISLSGGLDSRCALGFLRNGGVNLKAYTFGSRESVEVRRAEDVARAARVPIDVSGVPEPEWTEWESNIQKLGATGTVQTCGWIIRYLRQVAEHHRAMVHGYLGDALTGKHLPANSNDVKDWIDYWTRFSVGPTWLEWPGIQKAWRNGMLDEVRDEFRQEMHGVEVAFGHQQAVHLDLYTRQRRWVASQANEMNDVIRPACFFYHPRLMRTWANVGYGDLVGQKLYRQANHAALPDLFPRELSGRWKSLQRRTERVRWFMRELARMDSRLGKSRVVMKRSDLLRATHGEASKRIKRVQESLDEVIDTRYVLDRLSASNVVRLSEIECAHIIRVVNVAHVVDLCQGESLVSGTTKRT